jgi:hypothetical protein
MWPEGDDMVKLQKVPKLTKLEFETIRHLLYHCGRWDHCGMDEKQIKVLMKKIRMQELRREHENGGKFYHE